MKKRIVIAGFGDTGVLLAIHLGAGFDIVGISPKPCLVSGQELGMRLARPAEWQKDYLLGYQRFRKLDGVRVLQGLVTRVDTRTQSVEVSGEDGSRRLEPYDALVIASGASNGFWRNDRIETLAAVREGIAVNAARLRAASSVAVVGGGASGVSVAVNLAKVYRDKSVHLFYSQDRPLPGYHPAVREQLLSVLRAAGVSLHPDHRAQLPKGFRGEEITGSPLLWASGQDPVVVDATVWAVGQLRPNSAFVPPDMLNAQGFVKADDKLRVPGYANVFTIGDIAATDPQRSSARNWAFKVLAHNLRAWARSGGAGMRSFEAPAFRWGSLYGVQDDGLTVYQPEGGKFRIPLWTVRHLLTPIVVRSNIYRGIRRERD